MMKQYLLFEVAENKYAIETTGVSKIVSMKAIIGIPNTPQDVKGLIYVGGRIIVVGGKKYPYNQNNRTKVGNELSSQ